MTRDRDRKTLSDCSKAIGAPKPSKVRYTVRDNQSLGASRNRHVAAAGIAIDQPATQVPVTGSSTRPAPQASAPDGAEPTLGAEGTEGSDGTEGSEGTEGTDGSDGGDGSEAASCATLKVVKTGVAYAAAASIPIRASALRRVSSASSLPLLLRFMLVRLVEFDDLRP